MNAKGMIKIKSAHARGGALLLNTKDIARVEPCGAKGCGLVILYDGTRIVTGEDANVLAHIIAERLRIDDFDETIERNHGDGGD